MANNFAADEIEVMLIVHRVKMYFFKVSLDNLVCGFENICESIKELEE